MPIKTVLKRGFIAIFALVAIAGALLFGNDYLQKRQFEKMQWQMLVDEFKGCSMLSALHRMGVKAPGVNSIILDHQIETDPLGEILLSGPRRGSPTDLEKIWIDPAAEGSLSNEKKTPTSINLLDQCNARIKEGHVQVWLEVGKFYLATGHSQAVEWLNKATEAGVADAHVLLGHGYSLGLISTVKNEKQAFFHYLKAAKMGSPKGQLYVAEMLSSVDPAQARKYVVAAAQSGSWTAAYILQNPARSFLFSAPGRIIDESALRIAYFWSLILNHFHSELKKENPYNLLLNSKPSFLEESPTEFLFDGLPTSVWNGNERYSSDRKVITRYNMEDAKANQARLEAQINADGRIVVQDMARKWIEARAAVKATQPDTKPVESETASSTAPLPAWNPVRLSACEGSPTRMDISSANLFKNFKTYVWTITAKSKIAETVTIGTAVAVAPGLLATNCHVVNGKGEIKITQDQTSHDAVVFAGDATRDTCLLEVKEKLPFAANAIAVSKLDVGTVAYALGNPQGVGLTFSNGIVSGVRRTQGRDFIQTTAPISKGSSGGALIDEHGNLLGITTFYLQGGQAMNFAIPIEDFCKK